ncbi:TetR-like C-terminal domain-containing protein [Isoptericola peretonis]|uniref:TetR-like C-terminal domain-containing protein n=1 Tax=Isoptericola peretonis TaxID=2918523 RepID=UPI003A522C35
MATAGTTLPHDAAARKRRSSARRWSKRPFTNRTGPGQAATSSSGRDPRRAATTSGIASGATPADRGDLRALTGRVAELLTDPARAPIAATLLSAGVERPELAAVSSAFFGDRPTREQPVRERAARRGEPVADVDLRTVMDLLVVRPSVRPSLTPARRRPPAVPGRSDAP